MDQKYEMSVTSSIKSALYQHCRLYVEEKINLARQGISQSQQAASQEGKSSAGDKFETHRAMMHLELEGFISRLEVAEAMERVLLSILDTKPHDEVRLGALVETDRGHYYIAVSAPMMRIGEIDYRCISTEAPLYKALAGKRADELVEWRTPLGEEEWIDIVSVL